MLCVSVRWGDTHNNKNHDFIKSVNELVLIDLANFE